MVAFLTTNVRFQYRLFTTYQGWRSDLTGSKTVKTLYTKYVAP